MSYSKTVHFLGGKKNWHDKVWTKWSENIYQHATKRHRHKKRLWINLPVGFPSKITYICEPFRSLNFHSTLGFEPKSAEYEHVRSVPEITELTVNPKDTNNTEKVFTLTMQYEIHRKYLKHLKKNWNLSVLCLCF